MHEEGQKREHDDQGDQHVDEDAPVDPSLLLFLARSRSLSRPHATWDNPLARDDDASPEEVTLAA